MTRKIPKRYIPSSLSKKDENAQKKSILLKIDRPHSSSFQSKRSPWVKTFEKKYGVVITNVEFISTHILKKAGIDKILEKGRAAYYTGGSRPNQTQHSWAYARLAAVIMGGKGARQVDSSIWEKHRVRGKENYDQIIGSFMPNVSPRQMFKLGSFGGTYWRPIESSVSGKSYKNVHLQYPSSWWKNIPEHWMTTSFDDYTISLNKYGVKVGTTLEFWESKDWINEKHPYGWVQWYCDWCKGLRCSDDIRQIKRWLGIAGPRGRFRRMLINLIVKKGGEKKMNDFTISPKIRQTLQHWGYKIRKKDFI